MAADWARQISVLPHLPFLGHQAGEDEPVEVMRQGRPGTFSFC